MPTVKAHDAALATRLVDAAARILAEQGASALTLRRVAAEAGTSTMAVYTLFGDKQGLLAAMHREGFRRLGAAMTAAEQPAGDPLGALAALGFAYRAAALASPHLYGLMFGTAAPDFRPGPDDEAAAAATFGPLVAAVRRCLDAGALVGTDAERIALHLWIVSHGVMSLELAGQLNGGDADVVYRDALVHSVAPFLPGTVPRWSSGSA